MSEHSAASANGTEAPATLARAKPFGRRVRLGVAIGPDAMVAVELRSAFRGPRPEQTHLFPIEPHAGDNGSWPGLNAAFRELSETLAPQGIVSIDVALLPPLSQTKSLSTLPPLRRRELRQLVERNAPRFFTLRNGSVVADALGRGGGPPAHKRGAVLATAAEGLLVQAVLAAARDARFRVGIISAGPVASAAGITALAPALKRGRVAVAQMGDAGTEVLFLDRGKLRMARSIPRAVLARHGDEPLADEDRHGNPHRSARDLARWIERALRESSEIHGFVSDRLVLAGSGGMVETVAAATDQDALPSIVRVPALEGRSAADLAAFGAVALPAEAPLLLPPDRRAILRRQSRRRTGVLVGASALFFFFAAALHLIDLRREIAAVEAERATLRPAVAEVLRARAAIQDVQARLASFSALENARADWVPTFAALATALPPDAHLAGIRSEADELHLEVRARSASAVVPALERSGRLQNVRLVAPVRREESPDGAYDYASLAAELESPVQGMTAGTGNVTRPAVAPAPRDGADAEPHLAQRGNP